jgi:hypothetical protein
MFAFYSIFKSLKCETLIEIGRYRKISREDRLCLYCENKIDDECYKQTINNQIQTRHFKKETVNQKIIYFWVWSSLLSSNVKIILRFKMIK